MEPWLAHPLLFAAGVVAGALNVVAGGGSFLTLPILIFLGLPPGVANGTNRIAILVQNVGAVWGFDRHRLLSWRLAAWAGVPAILGALAGAWLALAISDETFQRALALLMVAVTLWTLWDPLRPPARAAGAAAEPAIPSGARAGLLAAGFFAAGVYGGFIQAGVGFLLLAATTAAGLDLVRGNALKVLLVLLFTPLTLLLFAGAGKVDWLLGASLAAGHLAGGLLGVRLTVLKGHAWLRRVVTATVIVFAVKLWWG